MRYFRVKNFSGVQNQAERDKTTQWMTHMSAARLVARHTAYQGGRAAAAEGGGPRVGVTMGH